MQVKLVCTDLVALARSRPTAIPEITLSGVREGFLGVVSLRWRRVKSSRSAPATSSP
jgi:hypothetical protein